MNDSKKKDKNLSIDEKHQDMVNIFHVIERETIPKLTDEIEIVVSRIKKIENKHSEEYYEMIDTWKEMKKKLLKLKKQKTKYLLDNSKYIFHYYEEKQKISSNENIKDVI
jgi:hypothetical protein